MIGAIARAGLHGRAESTSAQIRVDAQVWFNSKRALDLAALRGHPVLIEYWATWCPACLHAIPMLNALQVKYAGRGLLIIGVTGDAPTRVRDFVRRHDIRYLVAAGATDDTMRRADQLPKAVLLHEDGTLWVSGTVEDAHRALESGAWSGRADSTEWLAVGSASRSLAERPPEAREYSSAEQQIVEDALAQKSKRSALSANELQRLFAFHWRNLPHDAWPGDPEVRLRAAYTLGDLLRSKDSTDAAVVEWCRRMAVGEPDRAVRYALFCALAALETLPPNPRMRSILDHHARHEPDPKMARAAAYVIDRSADNAAARAVLDPAYERFADEYEQAVRSLRRFWPGLRSPFKEAQAHQRAIEECLRLPTPQQQARYLMADYRSLSTPAPAASWMRTETLVALFLVSDKERLADPDRLDAQSFLLEALANPSAGAKERITILGNLDRFGSERLSPQALTPILDRLDRAIPHPDMRAHTDHWRIRLTNPTRLDAACPAYVEPGTTSSTQAVE
ncbi:MAG: TlpA disulfide reductase family protein [Phycisphaerae bacterium]